ncbi:MAG TPA: hypothetical protein VK132_09655 [Gemmatimonadales bacterium]|nr:hypothetical protein [Gemmatimonadales bacterium]
MDRRKGLVIAAGSLGGTALLVGLVFSLGGWAYQHRRSSLHDGRLRRLVAEHPSEDRVSRGILAESGNWPIATPASEAKLRQLVARWSPSGVDEVVAKSRKWNRVRVFGVRDVAYVLYFDDDGMLRDYVLLSK